MQIARYLQLLLFSLLLASHGFAAETAAPLTADMAARLAVANSLEQMAEKEQLQGVQTAAETTPYLANPVLELEGETGSLTGSPDDRTLSISLTQEIPLSAAPAYRRELAKREAAVAKARLRRGRLLLEDQARRAWAAAAVANGMLRLAKEGTAVLDRLYGTAKVLQQAGELSEGELELAKLELHRQQLKERELEGVAVTAARRLAFLLGTELEQLPPLAGLEVPSGKIVLANLLKTVEAESGSVAVARQEAALEETSLRLAEAEMIPPLAVTFSYRNERSSQNRYELANGHLLEGKEITRDHILGVRLSIPLPVFSRNQAEVAKGVGRSMAARRRVEEASRNSMAELNDLVERFNMAVTTVQYHRSIIAPAVKEGVKVAEAAFRLGESGIQPALLQKQRLLEQGEAELLATESAFALYSQIVAATGSGAAELSGGLK